MIRLVLLAPLLLLVALGAPSVRADETTLVAGPSLELEHLDLLPLGEFEREDFRKAHPDLSRRLQSLAGRIRGLERKLQQATKGADKKGGQARKGKRGEDPVQKLRTELARVHAAADAPLAELRDELLDHGLTDAMLLHMARAPKGQGRLERYSHGLVLLLDGLDADQRRIFDRAIPEIDGAYLSAQALRDRTELALKQSGMEKREIQGVLTGFRRQTQVVESRFWRLVDYVLHDDQKAALWEMLPTRMRRHASPQDHVFALPGLEPAQGARVRALITEIEAESAPDQALVNRVKRQVRDAKRSREEKAALLAEQREANVRLQALRRFAHEATHEILTPEQIHAMKAIPPRVSSNDRRRDGRRVLAGMDLTAAQQQQMDELRKEGRRAAKAYRERMRELRAETGEVGPDSPQMMMMEMMSASARGEALTQQRLLLGRVFREVLTPDQVSGWVQGLYGDRR